MENIINNEIVKSELNLETILDNLFIDLDNLFIKNYDRFNMQQLFIIFTKLLSYKSACAKTRQAALIVKNNRIISFGYNGPPENAINCIAYKENGEQICGKDSAGSCLLGIHAEQNAIAFASKNGISIENCEMYITESPCIHCARLLSNSGINKIYYLKKYRLEEGLNFLKNLESKNLLTINQISI